MNISLIRRLALAFVVGTQAVLLLGCAVGGEYGYYGGDVGADYYEPYGYEYGYWGPDYDVAPFRGDHDEHHRATHEGGHEPERAYRPAPASHPTPSIPSQSRSGGGGRGGGGKGGEGGRGSGERGK